MRKLLLVMIFVCRFIFAGVALRADEAELEQKIEKFMEGFVKEINEKDFKKAAARFGYDNTKDGTELEYFENFIKGLYKVSGGIKKIEIRNLDEKIEAGSVQTLGIDLRENGKRKYNIIVETQYKVIYEKNIVGVLKIDYSNILGEIKIQNFSYTIPSNAEMQELLDKFRNSETGNTVENKE